MLGVPYPVQFTRAPLVLKAEHQQSISRLPTKGARVNCTGYGTPNMFNKQYLFAFSECSSKGGSAKGKCAAGFGVCCVFTLSSSSSTTVNYNDTYIQNPDFPSAYGSSSTLSYTVNKCSNGNIIFFFTHNCHCSKIHFSCQMFAG